MNASLTVPVLIYSMAPSFSYGWMIVFHIMKKSIGEVLDSLDTYVVSKTSIETLFISQLINFDKNNNDVFLCFETYRNAQALSNKIAYKSGWIHS